MSLEGLPADAPLLRAHDERRLQEEARTDAGVGQHDASRFPTGAWMGGVGAGGIYVDTTRYLFKFVIFTFIKSQVLNCFNHLSREVRSSKDTGNLTVHGEP